MSGTTKKAKFEKKEFSDEEKKEYREQKLQELQDSIKQLFVGDNFKNWLLTRGNKGYSPLNQLYILSQLGERKGSVAGAKQWYNKFATYFKEKQNIVVREVGIKKSIEKAKEIRPNVSKMQKIYSDKLHTYLEYAKTKNLDNTKLEQLKQDKDKAKLDFEKILKEYYKYAPIFITAPVMKNITLSIQDIEQKVNEFDKKNKDFNDKRIEEGKEPIKCPKWYAVLESMKQKGETSYKYEYISGFRLTPIYSVSNLEFEDVATGKKLDLPETTLGKNDEVVIAKKDKVDANVVYDKLLNYAKKIGCKVSTNNPSGDRILGNAYGYFSPMTNEIVLRDDLKPEQRISVLTHELAHASLHGKEMKVEGIANSSVLPNTNIKEIEAESVAWAVMQECGYDNNSSFEYIGLYAEGDIQKLAVSLNRISKTIDQIADSILEKVEKQDELKNEQVKDDFEDFSDIE